MSYKTILQQHQVHCSHGFVIHVKTHLKYLVIVCNNWTIKIGMNSNVIWRPDLYCLSEDLLMMN